jgi:hypothetical protein
MSPVLERIHVLTNERSFMQRKASAVWRGDLKGGNPIRYFFASLRLGVFAV